MSTSVNNLKISDFRQQFRIILENCRKFEIDYLAKNLNDIFFIYFHYFKTNCSISEFFAV